MPRCACGGPDLIKVQQARIKERVRRRQMAHGRHATNGKAGLGANESCIGLAQRLARQCAGLGRVDLIAPGGDKQQGGAAGLTQKDDRFGNLINTAPHQICSHLRGGGLSDFNRCSADPGGLQGCGDAFEAFRHDASPVDLGANPARMRNMTQDIPDPDLLAELLAMETRVWQALLEGDAGQDRALLLPEFLGVYPSGFSGREGHAEQLEGGPSVARYHLSEARVLPVGERHVMLCYRAEYLRIGAAGEEAMYVSSLWQREGAAWRNLFSQDTPVSDQPVP